MTERIDWQTLRREKGWSQRKLAMEAGISQTTVHEIEIGYREPTDEQREALITALSVPL